MSFQVGADTAWYFALPEWLPQMTLYFQDWMLDGSTFSSTRRLEVPVVK